MRPPLRGCTRTCRDCEVEDELSQSSRYPRGQSLPPSQNLGLIGWNVSSVLQNQPRSAETEQPFNNALWAEKARVIIICIPLKVFSIIMVIKKQIDSASNRV
jgi:hypothetical protein